MFVSLPVCVGTESRIRRRRRMRRTLSSSVIRENSHKVSPFSFVASGVETETSFVSPVLLPSEAFRYTVFICVC